MTLGDEAAAQNTRNPVRSTVIGAQQAEQAKETKQTTSEEPKAAE